ncbi:MAG: hypothetical protein A2W90_00855 [Bacteroidetes bacterium GWF2_42_66]|nr:MAG: hypothetical protein A2W89_12255 [Bacteroidetes bacterium GWE2_42_39]OFY40456.1 MAG: hypothetical protein A2W90_00855 [Bacteroidetes bacterium GWF2_42_66]HBL76922.1 hypothetical protein [Prolixibacteraceae bacterium]HCR90429.1 hypothetical protein [Prolixibacteraceae bacterium]HCU62698.1 hypothetical protein [Prolixibacteraceae bacterium]
MRKLTLIIAAIAFFSVSSNAQEMFEKGTQLFKLGVGLNGNGTPVEVSYEKGVKDDFLGVDGLVLGLGGNLGYYGYKEDFAGYGMNYSWKYTNIVIAARGLVHYPLINKLDTYGGLVLGYNVASTKYDGPNAGSVASPSAGGLVVGGLVGARYEFSENFGAYVEVGYSISYANIGIAYKF